MTQPPDYPPNPYGQTSPPGAPVYPDGSALSYESSMLQVKDVEHLKVLSICWYVYAGFQCLGICVGVVYMVIGLFALAGAIEPHDPDSKVVGGILTAFGGGIALLVGVIAFLSFLVGKSLSQRRRATLCYIMSALACLNLPMGTVLGIFTFVVLARPSVKAAFQQAQ